MPFVWLKPRQNHNTEGRARPNVSNRGPLLGGVGETGQGLPYPEAVGRMVSIHPKSGDTFYLRLLLKNRSGALSYEDLRTIEDVEHPDNKSACIALNLCESDKQWVDCLKEAVFMSVPHSIRQLFVNILLHCQPSDPLSIYNEFRNDMSEDF